MGTHEDQYIYLIIPCYIPLRMRNVLARSYSRSITFSFENCVIYEIMWKNIVEPERPHDSIVRVHCMLDT